MKMKNPQDNFLISSRRLNIFSRMVLGMLLFFCVFPARAQRTAGNATIMHWTGTWATAQQTPVRSYMPYNNCMSHRSVRQVVKVSAGGDMVRLKLSNIFSDEPVEISSVYIAEALTGSEIRVRSARYLTFEGHRSVKIEARAHAVSDPLRFTLKPLSLVAITINYTSAPKTPTVHMGSRTTSYILKGISVPRTSFAHAFRYEKWFNIAALEVYGKHRRAVAILGNSITDGKGSTTDKQDRWPDEMSMWLNREFLPSFSVKKTEERLTSSGKKADSAKVKKNEEQKLREKQETDGQTAVLNLGIGNNRVLTVGYGQPGKERFDRDILGQSGLTDVIIFEGINDLGTTRNVETTVRQLIAAYQEMVTKAHAHHLRVWLATITPMKGSAYYTQQREEGREQVNRWIREQHEADGIIDFDACMRSTADPHELRSEWRLADCLHPNAEGYRQMGHFAAERIK